MSTAEFRFPADLRFIRAVARSQTTTPMRLWRHGAALLAALTAVAIVARNVPLIVVAAAAFAAASFGAARALRPVRQVVASLSAQYSQLPPPREIAVRVDDRAMSLDNGRDAVEIPWSRVTSLHRARGIWWVHADTGESLPLPANAIPADVAAIIESNVPKVTSG